MLRFNKLRTAIDEIERVGAREGWRAFPANRDGLFDVVEFRVENWLTLELLTPVITSQYLQVPNPQHLPELIDPFALAEARR